MASIVLPEPYPLMVTVADHSGLFMGVTGVGDGDFLNAIKSAAPVASRGAEGDQFVVLSWLGGGCDDAVRLEIGVAVRSIEIVTVTGTDECVAIGDSRHVKLRFNSPIALARLSLASTHAVSSFALAVERPWPTIVVVDDRSSLLDQVEEPSVGETAALGSAFGALPSVAGGVNRKQLLLAWESRRCDESARIVIGEGARTISVQPSEIPVPPELYFYGCSPPGTIRVVKLVFSDPLTDEVVVTMAAPPAAAKPTPEAASPAPP
jgi:hypothetical protein